MQNAKSMIFNVTQNKDDSSDVKIIDNNIATKGLSEAKSITE